MIHAEYVFSIKNALKMAEIGKYYFLLKVNRNLHKSRKNSKEHK